MTAHSDDDVLYIGWHSRDLASDFGIQAWVRSLSSFLDARHDVDDATRKLLVEILYNVMILTDVTESVVTSAATLFVRLLRYVLWW